MRFRECLSERKSVLWNKLNYIKNLLEVEHINLPGGKIETFSGFYSSQSFNFSEVINWIKCQWDKWLKK